MTELAAKAGHKRMTLYISCAFSNIDGDCRWLPGNLRLPVWYLYPEHQDFVVTGKMLVTGTSGHGLGAFLAGRNTEPS